MPTRPVHEIRLGRIKATIWPVEVQNARPVEGQNVRLFNTTFARITRIAQHGRSQRASAAMTCLCWGRSRTWSTLGFSCTAKSKTALSTRSRPPPRMRSFENGSPAVASLPRCPSRRLRQGCSDGHLPTNRLFTLKRTFHARGTQNMNSEDISTADYQQQLIQARTIRNRCSTPPPLLFLPIHFGDDFRDTIPFSL